MFNRTDLDLVVNASFSNEHYPITLDLLKHGLNVVSEKPFAMHAADCADMIQAAKDNNASLCVFQQSHFAPYYRTIRKVLDSGVLGRIAEIKIQFSGFARRWDWQCSQRMGGGCLLNTGPHPMEQALDLLDSDEMPVVASRLDRMNSFGDAEDFVKVLLLQPGKPVIDVEISGCNHYPGFTYLIQGSHGSLRATMSELEYKYYLDEEAPKQTLLLNPLEDADGTPKYCSEQLQWHEVKEEIVGTAFIHAVAAYYDNIYDHLVNGADLIIRSEKIMQQIAIMEEIHRQNPMPVKY